MKRILLFVLTNLAVLTLASAVAHILGLDAVLAQKGINFGGLLVMGALFGFAGSFVSLWLSKWMAKNAMGVRVIEQPATGQETWLVETVRRQAGVAGVGMPEVGIFDSPELNAFATGASRNNALVAVSSGLLARMSADEVEAVIGHELSHVANGDMVTMTLLQGVLNTFVFALARVVGALVDRDDRRGGSYLIVVMVTQVALGALASLILMWFSRQREFRADAGGAHLAGRDKMIAALRALQANHPAELPNAQLAAFGIAGGEGGLSLRRLMMSHPPLEERIAALQNAN
jgi:heat shock protein HtpX